MGLRPNSEKLKMEINDELEFRERSKMGRESFFNRFKYSLTTFAVTAGLLVVFYIGRELSPISDSRQSTPRQKQSSPFVERPLPILGSYSTSRPTSRAYEPEQKRIELIPVNK